MRGDPLMSTMIPMLEAKSATLLSVALIATTAYMLSFSELRTMYLMIGLKKTASLIFWTRSRHLGEGLVRLTTMMTMTTTTRIKIKAMVASNRVAPKLSKRLDDPSLSSPTFSSVDEVSFAGIPIYSMMIPPMSKSSINSPRATRFSS